MALKKLSGMWRNFPLVLREKKNLGILKAITQTINYKVKKLEIFIFYKKMFTVVNRVKKKKKSLRILWTFPLLIGFTVV